MTLLSLTCSRLVASAVAMVALAVALTIPGIAHASDSEDCVSVDGEKAISACTRLIEAGKEKGSALASLYFNRGTAYNEFGKQPESIADLTRAIELRKDYANAFYNRGLAYWRAEEYDKSVADFTTYLKLDPKSPETFRVRGRSYRGKGDYDRALADLNEFMRRTPGDVWGFHERGLIYQAKGDLPRAVAQFEQMVKADPRNDTGLVALAAVLSEQGEDTKAITRYDEAIRINPSAAHYIARGDVYAKLKSVDSALADYERATKADPSNAQAMGNLAWAHTLKGDFAQAFELFGQAIRLEPDNADYYDNRGWSLLRLNNYSRAKTDLDRALQINPEHAMALFHRGVVLTELGQFDPAIADLTAAQRLDAKNVEFVVHRGWAYVYKDDHDRAAADFTRGAEMKADDVDAHAGLCWALSLKGQFDKASTHCDKAVELLPENPDVLQARGLAKLRMGAPALALADLDRALSARPDSPSIHADRGRVHEARGDRGRALADYQKALSLTSTGYYDDYSKVQATQRLTALIAAVAAAAPAVAAPQAPASPVAPEKRVALVIGNSAYKNVSALSNPRNDAGAVAASLRRLGFNNVVEKYDLSRQELTQTLQAFGDVAEDADWAVIYYAGHGIEIGGVNYVIPVDAALKVSTHVDDEALSLDRVMATVGTAKKMKLVILDACRDNPFVPKMRTAGASRSAGRGLGRIEPPAGVLVAYAARDGLVAMDGETGNSPFATALVEHMEEQGVEINLLFRKVRDAVFRITQGKQEPYTYGSLPAQQFFFRTQ